MEIILDPNLYKLNVNKLEDQESVINHLSYFDFVLDFIVEYQIGNFFWNDLLQSELFSEDMENPWNRYPQYQKGIKTVLQKKFFRNINFHSQLHDISKEPIAEFVSEFNFPNEDNPCETFLKTLNYILSKNIESLIFYGTINHNIQKPSLITSFKDDLKTENAINPVFNPLVDFHDQLRNKATSKLELNKEEIFPMKQYSKELGELYYNQISRTGLPDKSEMTRYGKEIALRNGYIYTKELSSKNQTYFRSLRTIFKRSDGKYYLSIDYEKGAFEVFNEIPIHIGEFKFTGEFNQVAQPKNHILVL